MSAGAPAAVAIAESWYEAVNAGDLDRALELLSDDVVWISPPDVPRPGTYVGHAHVRGMWNIFSRTFDGFRIETGEMTLVEGRALVPVTISGNVKASGSPFEMRGAQVIDTGGELISGVREFLTVEEAREAAGQPIPRPD